MDKVHVKTRTVGGRQVITTSNLVYCNTKYHAPYLAVVRGEDFDWVDKEFVGYGKYRETYYVVENLQPGDLIQAAGGSGGNKYPFKGRIVSIDDEELVVEEMNEVDFSNARIVKAEPRSLDESELAIVDRLITLSPDRLSLILSAVRNEKGV